VKLSRPWGIHTVFDMWSGPGEQAQVKHYDGNRLVRTYWVRAVCEPYHVSVESLRQRFTVAWWVFTGRAFAVKWPEPGDLEAIVSGTTPAGKAVIEDGHDAA